MRQIKFRAWFKGKERMVYFENLGFTNQFECAHPTLYADNGEHWYSPKDWDGNQPDIMQFTGLSDKNGKEIFEGDVIKWNPWNDYKTNPERKWEGPGIIEWDWCRARFNAKGTIMGLIFSSFQYEVIGNIYENPELLASRNQT